MNVICEESDWNRLFATRARSPYSNAYTGALPCVPTHLSRACGPGAGTGEAGCDALVARAQRPARTWCVEDEVRRARVREARQHVGAMVEEDLRGRGRLQYEKSKREQVGKISGAERVP